MITQAPVGPVERNSVRLAAVLLLAGVVVTAIAGFLHAEGPDPNDHQTIFAIYAASTAVHIGQFVGMVIITFGLVALFFALDVRSGVGLWLNRFALLSAGAAMALYSALQAVDGVGLKQGRERVGRRCRSAGWSALVQWGCYPATSTCPHDAAGPASAEHG